VRWGLPHVLFIADAWWVPAAYGHRSVSPTSPRGVHCAMPLFSAAGLYDPPGCARRPPRGDGVIVLAAFAWRSTGYRVGEC